MTKNEAISVIQSLPDDVTTTQIIQALQIQERNLKAMNSIAAGKGISEQEVDKIAHRWFDAPEARTGL